MSTSPLRMDPFTAFNFVVALIDSSSALGAVTSIGGSSVLGGFSECSGLEIGLDMEEYREGGNNAGSLHFPTRIKWSNLRFKRGITSRDDLWQWQYGFAQGSVKRRDGLVTLLDEQKNPVKLWSFTRGLPIKWSGPTLNASQSQIANEELEIAHEGLTLL
jgi:phage tail-like protein